jgi:hypothetical protein
MYQPRRRLPPPRAYPEAGVDRFAFGFAIFSAFLFAGTMTLLCAVIGLAVLLWRNETRWGQLAGWLAAQPSPGWASPVALPTVPAGELSSPLPTPTEAAAVIVDPPVEPTPTVAIFPTETPTLVAPPSELPTPTPTLDPFASTPGLPSAGGDYTQNVIQRVDLITNGLNQLTALLITPQLGDDNWRGQVTAQTAIIHQIYNELNNLPAPPELFAVQTSVINAVGSCMSGVYTVDEALRANDPQYVQQGSMQISQCLPGLAAARNTASGS